MIYCLHICEYAAMTERVPRRASRTENTRRRLKARMGQAAGEVHSRASVLNIFHEVLSAFFMNFR